MSEPTIPNEDRQRRLEEAMAEYLIAADAGRTPEPESFLVRYPDLRAELVEFMADLSGLAALVEPLLPAGAIKPGPGNAPEQEPTVLRSDESTTGGGTTSGPGATIASDPSTDAGSAIDPAATAKFGEGANGTTPSVALPGGTRVRYFGDFELIRELGRGGMGIVYKAHQVSLNRLVALKMIKLAALASDDERRRFQNEAEAVATLDHPHIVPILEVGNYDGQRYFTTKLIGGTSLNQKLTDYVAEPRSAAKLLKQVAEAVHHAHQRGILHRDLKPANVLLDERGEPFVTDFGLAKRLEGDSALTLSGAIMGTPAYMAPEQASGRRGAVTTASDVYGLGAILYAVLTGRAPCGGDSVEETLEQVRNSAPSPPSKINPRVPRDLETICLKCLEKDPARRYASAQALADDLGRYLADEPITARPTGALERGWLWCKRNPWLAGAIGTTIAALVAAAVISLVFAAEQTKAKNQIKGLANSLQSSLKKSEGLAGELKTSLKESERRLAALNYERGHTACEKGEMGPGLLRLAESWRLAVAADNPDWRHTARASLSAWQRHYVGPRAIFSHAGAVDYVAFSPDGKTVLTGSRDKTARLWDATTGRPKGAPMTHQGAVRGVAFSPDGKTVLTGSADSTARLWDAATGRPIGAPMTHQGAVGEVAFSPDGKTVLTGSADSTARLWDAATGGPLGPPMTHQGTVLAVAFSPGGKTVLTGSADKTARLWDAATGWPLGTPMTHHGTVLAVAFSPDGKTVLTGSTDKTARLWDAATGRPLALPMTHQNVVLAVAFSPDGKTVLTGSRDKTARLWDAATGRPLALPMTHQNAVDAVAFSPDGKTVLTGGDDDSARLWDAPRAGPSPSPWPIRARSWPWRTARTARPSSPGALTRRRGSGTRRRAGPSPCP